MNTWKHTLILSILIGAAILIGTLNIRLIKPPVEYNPAPIIEEELPINEQILEQKVNDYRISKGLTALINDQNLCQYAEIRATQIKTDWSHAPFQSNRCKGTGYTYCGENLSKDFRTEEDTLEAWLNSETHHKNIKSNWSATCVKCSDNYCAQEFGI